MNAETQAFYLSDFKMGYDEGFKQGKTGENAGLMNSSRPGYNEGFKQGYDAGAQARLQAPEVKNETVVQSAAYRQSRPQVVYRDSPVYEKRRGTSKMRTALRIAAPAAVGAGIGALAGGKKGAGVGALIGGGGGALYHLYKERKQ
jgi:hypothetical protein